MTKLLI